jgi:nucleotide-binding universal stress UspA family protein
MITLGTILVPHDFSPASDAALRRAVEIAKGVKGRIHVLHAYAWPVRGVMPYQMDLPAGVADGIRAGIEEKLAEICTGIGREGVAASADASADLPVDAIVGAAEKLGAGLIVMGTRGLTGLKHVVLGSVAERTVRLAPCPVLAVKEDDRGGPTRKILAATDFSPTGDHAGAVAESLAKQLGAELHLVHAIDIPLTMVTPYEVTIPDNLIRDSRAAARKKLDAGAARLAASGGPVPKAHLTEVPAAPAIADLAREIGADLVVIGTRGHTGLKHVLLGSVAERTLRLAPCAVLAVKSEAHQLDD